ncbi:ClpX C4-type zinc finger protein [Rhizobium leguminosarum]|uniref:ClpX C4-type zinc finger protein n=1 Tax=Rhizobium leguminosarum TaxID=384 RepID=UPI003F9C6191
MSVLLDKSLDACSFCDKGRHRVFHLVQGPNLFICDECVEQCNEFILDARYPGRNVLRVAMLRVSELDDALCSTIAALIGGRFPNYDLKYEMRQIKKASPGVSAEAIFTFKSDAANALAPVERALKKAVSELEVFQKRYLFEKEKNLKTMDELRDLKAKFYDHIIASNDWKAVDETSQKTIAFFDIKNFSSYDDDRKRSIIDFIRSLVPILFNEYGSTHINMWGDGIVATFDDPNDAIRCASRLIRHMLVESIELRVGMSWGTVRTKGNPALGRGDIDGGAVDFAARIEPLAEDGQILLSNDFIEDEIDPKLARLTKIMVRLVKPVAHYQAGDEIEVFRVNVVSNTA